MGRKNKRRGSLLGHAVLIVLLLGCMLGATYLASMGVLEIMERRLGDDFYASLAQEAEEPPADQAKAPAVQRERSSENALVLSEEAREEQTVRGMHATQGTQETQETHANREAQAAQEMQKTQEARTLHASASAQTTDGAALPMAGNAAAPSAYANLSEIDFPAIWRTCPDVVGWIRLSNSAIDYPVVLGEDNEFYLHHLPDGSANAAGSIMLDCANSGNFGEDVNILHGHHMRSGSMFGRLDDYRQEEYYRTHPTIRLYTPQGDYDAVVFAACIVDGYTFGYPTSFASEDDFARFVQSVIAETPYETDVNVQYGDRILLLSTCAYSFAGARFVVLGKMVQRVSD